MRSTSFFRLIGYHGGRVGLPIAFMLRDGMMMQIDDEGIVMANVIHLGIGDLPLSLGAHLFVGCWLLGRVWWLNGFDDNTGVGFISLLIIHLIRG